MRGGNAALIVDLHSDLPDATIRERWRAGHYDLPDGSKPRARYVTGWRALAGRQNLKTNSRSTQEQQQ